MRKSSILAVVGFAALAGCTTTLREMREHTPRALYDTARSERAMEACLAGNLSWISEPAIVHGETATELSFGTSGQTAVMVTLQGSPTGTHVEVRQQLTYGARVKHNVEACVTGRDR